MLIFLSKQASTRSLRCSSQSFARFLSLQDVMSVTSKTILYFRHIPIRLDVVLVQNVFELFLIMNSYI